MKICNIKLKFVYFIYCVSFSLIKFCQSQGFFDQEFPPFYENCGVVQENGDIRTSIPWVASVYYREDNEQPFKFLLTATILGPSLVLSIFGGKFGGSNLDNYALFDSENVVVGVGMKSTNFKDADEYTQILRVNYLLPYTEKAEGNNQYHFFLIHLKERINLNTPYARVLCLPPIELGTMINHGYGSWKIKVGGFASPRNSDGAYELKILTMTIGEEEYCRDKMNFFYRTNGSHVFCAIQEEKEENLNDGCLLHGSPQFMGVETGRNIKYFTMGLVALIPTSRKGLCTYNTTYFLANALTHLDWIYKNIECSPNMPCKDGTCIPLTSVCNLKKDCPGLDNTDENPIFCEASNHCRFKEKSHQCSLHSNCIRKEQLCDGVKNCFDSSDEFSSYCHKNKKKIVGLRKKSCPPPKITEEGVTFSCKNSKGEEFNCEKSEFDSIARLQCKDYHTSNYMYHSVTMRCQENGTWGPIKPFSCEAGCGIIETIPNRILNGKIVNTNETSSPWFTALFKKEDGIFQFICAASLISKNLLITAAKCFLNSDGEKITVENLIVVLSPVSLSFDENLADQHTQFLYISNYWTPPDFNPKTLQSDIALVLLNKPAVLLVSFVRPICTFISKFNKIPLTHTIGKMTSFSYHNGSTVLTNGLKYNDFPVISNYQCEYDLDIEIPDKTFCAGDRKISGTKLCSGEEGTGLAFFSESRYVLKGIVSFGHIPERFRRTNCASQNYSIFTHLDDFKDWIWDILENIGFVNEMLEKTDLIEQNNHL